MSSGYNRTDVCNANRQLNQRLRSNATLSKNWPDRGSSLSMNVSHEQDLIDKTNSQTLPNMRYNHGLIHFFPSEKQRKSSDKTLLYEPPEKRLTPSERIAQHSLDDEDEKWYNSLTMSYSTNLRNNRDENLVYNDAGERELHETWRSGMDHNISFKSPQKVIKYLNINPSISYSEDWLLERKKWFLDENGDAYSIQERGFFQRRTFNANLNSTTKIYGYFPINWGTVQTVRHVLTPTIGLRYQPDFSDPEFGYYQQLERTVSVPIIDPDIPDTTYEDVTYSSEQDRYSGSILGGTSRTRQLSTTFSLGNLFQMKRVELDDEGEEIESKLDLFTYNLSTSYNFAADSMRFGDLSANFRASPITAKNQIGPLKQLSVDFTTRHSFYQYDVENNRRVNKFYWDRENASGLNVLRMTSFSTNSRFTISGPSPFAPREVRAESKPDTVDTPRTQENIRRDINDRFGDRSERFTGAGNSPWTITGTARYSLSMDNPMLPRENLQIGATLSLKLTKMWSFSYGTNLNLLTKDIASSNLMVTRDLESWEGTFSWRPQGIGQGFYLKIGIKAPMLRDVKLEQRRGSGPLRQY
ncbi:hypothetical protein BMS3Bbin04_01518 [bacterium BMS3Bbin04]|nr:hypothetical protein BMS3Bbin04_01518 [bacterium BMS3Bbin04]